MVRGYNKDKKNVYTCFASDIYPIGSEYRNNELKTNKIKIKKGTFHLFNLNMVHFFLRIAS